MLQLKPSPGISTAYKISVLILFLLCSGCGHGPSVTECISNPKENNLHCYDYTSGKSLIKTFLQIESWACLHPTDEKNFLTACENKYQGPAVNFCLVDNGAQQLSCYDEASQKSNHIALANTENYICTSVVDFQAVLSYCARIKAENLK